MPQAHWVGHKRLSRSAAARSEEDEVPDALQRYALDKADLWAQAGRQEQPSEPASAAGTATGTLVVPDRFKLRPQSLLRTRPPCFRGLHVLLPPLPCREARVVVTRLPGRVGRGAPRCCRKERLGTSAPRG